MSPTNDPIKSSILDDMMFSLVPWDSISLLDAVDGFSFGVYKISQDKIVPTLCIHVMKCLMVGPLFIHVVAMIM